MNKKHILGFLVLSIIILFPDISAQITLETRKTNGLFGPVRIVTVESAGFTEESGEYILSRLIPTLTVQYTLDGLVAGKQFYDYRGSRANQSEYTYDSSGRLVSLITKRSSGGIAERIEYAYDPEGRILEKKYDLAYNPQTWTYEYDDSGKMTEARFRSGSGLLPGLYRLTYNVEGRLEKITRIRNDGTVHSERINRYNGDMLYSRVVKRNTEDGTVLSTYEYRFDGKGNILREVFRNNAVPFEMIWEHTYDQVGNKTRTTVYNQFGSTVSEVGIAYDERGRKVLERHTGISEHMEYSDLSTYDRYGNVTEHRRLNKDGSLQTLTINEYEYDRHGNWVSKKTFVSNNAAETYRVPYNLQERLISYY